MRIALLCATRRGYLFLSRLAELAPQADLIVASFREELWEPPFFDVIRDLTLRKGGQFLEARTIGNEFWESTSIDLMLVVSWRFVLPTDVFRRPHLGTFVFHDSLLPEYRGFSPTAWAIINGEDHTGVTLFEMVQDLDAGPIVDQERIPIGREDNIAAVMNRVTQAYLDLLERNLAALLGGVAERHVQDHSRATYTCKRVLEDNEIHWWESSDSICNLVRGTSAPYPGSYTYLGTQKLFVWSARRTTESRRYAGSIPGRIVEVRPGEGVVVLTGDGAILLTEMQEEGREIVCAAELLGSLTRTLGRQDCRGR